MQVALLIAFLCVHCARGWPSWAAFQYFEVVTLWFLVALVIFFIMHLFRMQGKMSCINWPLTVRPAGCMSLCHLRVTLVSLASFTLKVPVDISH